MGGVCSDPSAEIKAPTRTTISNQNRYDMEDYLNNIALKDTLSGQKIIYSTKVQKLNHLTGIRQERDILLTDKNFYNIKDFKTVQRTVKYSKILGITRS